MYWNLVQCNALAGAISMQRTSTMQCPSRKHCITMYWNLVISMHWNLVAVHCTVYYMECTIRYYIRFLDTIHRMHYMMLLQERCNNLAALQPESGPLKLTLVPLLSKGEQFIIS